MIDGLAEFLATKGYTISEPIGKGGMGEVYLGHDPRLNRPIAIKICSLSDHPNSHLEAQNLAALNHPNIVQVYDVLVHSGHTLIIMELVEGPTLKQHLKTTVLTEKQKLNIVTQICQALAHAHQRGVFHCDLKSSNVIVNQDNDVKLVDFGISISEHNPQPRSINYGSVLTASPEHLNGQALDQHSDLFCLGLLAFDMFYQRHPFVSKQSSLVDNMFKHPKLDAQSLLPLLPEALAQLLNQLVEVDKNQRPENSEDVLTRLRFIEQHYDMATDDTLAITKVLPAANQSKSMFKLFAAVLSLMLVSATLGYWLITPKEKETVLLLPSTALNTVKTNFTLTIDDALSQYFIQNDQFKLLPETDARLIDQMTAKSHSEQLAIAGKELGASVIIRPTIRCEKIFCQVKLQSYRAPSWYVHNEKSGRLNVENYTHLYTFSQTLLEQITGGHDISTQLNDGDEQNYQQYLSIKQAFLNGDLNNTSDKNSLDQLYTLLKQNNKIYSAYSLYRELALNTYHIDKNPEHLTQMEALLASSPSQYKQSESYHLDLFSLYQAQQEWEKARNVIELLKPKNPSHYYSLLGRWHYAQNQFKETKQYYLKSLELTPNLALRKSLAYLYYIESDFEQALNETLRIVNALPDDLFANQLLADIYMGQGEYKKSIQHYLSFIDSSQTPIDYSNLSLALWLDQQPEKALYYAQKALELATENTGIILNYADLLNVNAKTQQAHDYYQQIINKVLAKPSAQELLEKAQAYSQVGDHMNALKTLSSVVVNNENKQFYFYTATLVNTQAKQFESALVSFEESLQAGYPIEWFQFPWYQPLCKFTIFSNKAGSFCLQ
ncbi:serine/threonine-protein kinase [Pseudoalteromonas ulvae]|uniref:Protein kinase domain-containing protein n=1 Tax=Pseudoalteromonas ulvae TaxID=107327 RepID=A0A244CTY8_PSEDV|nr:serine/threonine-protein kinase [Pseudoalteromonas ulvae]OUL59092.1 hypothetical protein B1199_02090 [Pseudoalteromonas ulvae]